MDWRTVIVSQVTKEKKRFTVFLSVLDGFIKTINILYKSNTSVDVYVFETFFCTEDLNVGLFFIPFSFVFPIQLIYPVIKK